MQTLGEDLASAQPWDAGYPPAILPLNRPVGPARCLETGSRLVHALPTSQIIDGFHKLCFEPCGVRDSERQIGTDFDDCQIQKFYARVIAKMYIGDGPTIATMFGQLLGPNVKVTYHAEVGLMPGVTTVISPTLTIVVIDGTRTFQQLAVQGMTSLLRPTNVVGYGTVPLWFTASNWAHGHAMADGQVPGSPCLLVGHSYGGTAALVLAARYRFWNPARSIRFLTYGSPKPGDQRLADLVGRCQGINLANDNDLVTVFPPDRSTLLPVMIALSVPSILAWSDWIRPVNQVRMDADGTLDPNNLPITDFDTLSAITARILAHLQLNPISGHPIGEYLSRLELRCPVDSWPYTDPCITRPTVPAGSLGLTGHASVPARVPTPCCAETLDVYIDLCLRTSGQLTAYGDDMQAVNGLLLRANISSADGLNTIWSISDSTGTLSDINGFVHCLAGVPASSVDLLLSFTFAASGRVYSVFKGLVVGEEFTCSPLGLFVFGLPIMTEDTGSGDNAEMLLDVTTAGVCTPYPAGPQITSGDPDRCNTDTLGVINGSAFEGTAVNNLLTFSLGATGHAVSSTSTQINYELDTLPTSLGAFTVIVDNVNGTSAEVQIATVIDCPPGTVWLDSFADVDNTSLDLHVPSIRPPFAGYTIVAGAFEIIGNKLVAVGTSLSSEIFRLSPGANPGTMTLSFQFDATTNFVQLSIQLRGLLGAFNVTALVQNIGGDDWQIVVQDGVGLDIEPVTLLPETPYTLVIVDDGAKVTAEVNGVLAEKVTAVDAGQTDWQVVITENLPGHVSMSMLRVQETPP